MSTFFYSIFSFSLLIENTFPNNDFVNRSLFLIFLYFKKRRLMLILLIMQTKVIDKESGIIDLTIAPNTDPKTNKGKHNKIIEILINCVC